MSKSIYDGGLVPVDQAAARVIAPGAHFTPKCKIHVEEFIAPPPIVPKKQHPRAPSFVDLTGKKKGRFTVIGLMASNPRMWVVRCVCGTYTMRTTQSIKRVDRNPRANIDACRECMHLAFLRREEQHRRTGKDVNLEDVWS